MSKSKSLKAIPIAIFFLSIGIAFAVQPSILKSKAANLFEINETTISNQTGVSIPVSSPSPTPELTHNLVAAYYDVQNYPTAKLLLNNKGLQPIEIRPTLYSLDGIAMDIAPVSVQGNSHRFINLSDWANLGGASFQKGSLKLFHTGKDLIIGSQIYLEDNANSLSFEERLTEIGKFDSHRLEAIWAMPRNQTQVTFILSNTSDETIAVSAKLSRKPHQTGETQIFTLLPHQTRVLDLRNDFASGNQFANADVVGLSLEHAGSQSALKAHGQIKDAPLGYSNIVQFSNPNSGKSSELHGAGLHLGSIGGEEIEPVVAVKNVGAAQTDVTIKVPYTRADGTSGTVNLNPINLQPGEMRLANMNPVIQRSRQEQIEIAGIEVSYDAAPGSVIVSAQSIGESKDQMFRVPLADPLAQVSSTGGYPWRIEQTSRTVAYIKNMTDLEQEYVASLTWANGGKYTIGLKKIAPHKTIEIDVKKLRDQQTPDFRGTTIPLNMTRGQIKWSLHKKYSTVNPKNDDFALIGRSEQIDTINKTSSSYACQNCCAGGDVGAFISTDPSGSTSSGNYTLQVGDVVQYYAFIDHRDCYGWDEVSSYAPDDWDSSNNNVATINNNGVATILSSGHVEIETYLDGYYLAEGPCGPLLTENCPNQSEEKTKEQEPSMLVPPCGSCEKSQNHFNPDVNITAKPVVTIPQIIAIGKNLERSIQVTNPSNATINLTLSTVDGTGSATFSNGSTSMTITGTQNITIKGVTESSKKDNIVLKATWMDNNNTYTLKEEKFCILWVSLMLRISGQLSVDNSARDVYNTAVGTYTLSTFHSTGTANTLWRTGVEIVGTVSPDNFTNSIKLKREILGKKTYNNTTDLNLQFNPDDTSDSILRDDAPQSGNSNGKVYDLDAPGITTNNKNPVGYILRNRTNFREYATYTENGQEETISADLLWFSKTSIQKSALGDNLLNDVANDNIAGAGTINLSWNLALRTFKEENNNMNRILPLAATLAFLFPCENQPTVYGQQVSQNNCLMDKLGDCLVNKQDNFLVIKQDEEVKKLINIIRNENLVKSDSEKVVKAIDRLGELKAKEAVTDIAKLLTLDRGARYFDTENPPSGGIITPYSIYPAVKALNNIGETSVPDLIKVIEREETNSLPSENAYFTIMTIYRENLEKAVIALRKQVFLAETGQGSERILKAVKRLEDLIDTSDKNK